MKSAVSAPLSTADQLLANSREMYSAEQVSRAVDRWAVRVQLLLSQHTEPVLALTVMKGAMLSASWLLQRLPMAIELDYVHASRYRGETSGGELHWRYQPKLDMHGFQVLLIDDIFDHGYTMQAIKQWCLQQGAVRVHSVALARKQLVNTDVEVLDRNWLDCAAIDVPDEYVFGCGMDIHEHWRHLPAIYAYQGE